ncbi:nicotinate-nucleotide adenylyltransferase [Natronoglycomyces albus]|uniref:Probable nicotinate-nucleotide adenylyltransferase n=1 Tax=Natronoglycomyces albus TaxID=2811108 RepID=A0A895XN64_9ACTN|nr:nicotinate-nucleotide adenylyltransferase [Natronoglycomyces albus]QSB04485.1 nicotinate-nucleotide adenylyltransferase [Natronoglycomyces albus]
MGTSVTHSDASASKIGIMGGTFDPIHFAHLAAASEAFDELQLDEVVFVPAGDPWQKSGTGVLASEHRLAMTRLATQEDDRFRVSGVDVQRRGATYAVDTVAAVVAEYDRLVRPYFIIGADTLERLHTWHRIEDLWKQVTFVVVNRPGHSRKRVKLPEDAEVIFVDMPGIEVSSTVCRMRAQQGKPLHYLTPSPVVAYIAQQRLYRR